MGRWRFVEYRVCPDAGWSKSYWFKGALRQARLEAVFKLLLPDRVTDGPGQAPRPHSQVRIDGKPVAITAKEKREWTKLQTKKIKEKPA